MGTGVYSAFETYEEFLSIKEQIFDTNVKVESRCLIKLLEQETLQDPKVTVGKALESILHWNGRPNFNSRDYKSIVRYCAIDELGLWNIADHKLRNYVNLKYLENLKR